MTAPRQYVSARELNGQRLTISFGAGADYQALGLRGFFEYRDLGVKAATGGRFQIGRAHVCTPVTATSRMPSSA